MKLKDLVRSLEIFYTHFNDKEVDPFAIDYDRSFTIDEPDIPLSEDRIKELKELGWKRELFGWWTIL